MITESTCAWLLSKRPSGDSSLHLSLFTRDKGIISCLYKGGRKSKKQSIAQPFMPLWVAYNKYREWYYIASLETTAAPIILENTSLFSALYLNELISYVLKPEDPHPEIYDAYEYVLNGLTVVTEPLAREALLRRFEWVLLKNCGQGLFLSEPGYNIYQFKAGFGFVPTENGFSVEEILPIVTGDFSEVSVLRLAKMIMRQAIDHLLAGRTLTSRRLFRFKNNEGV